MGQVIKMNGKEQAFGTIYSRIQDGAYDEGYAKFRDDLHEAYEVSGHPKSGLLFLMAFHRGVTGGKVGILREYDELVNLLI